ncbi:MAG: SRPBCC domain-containing protein [Actinomycetia bacterium]|nr:SRPBCC domain-containing protein [Actinomycetes bacterium]MCP4083535.1 SRPBCC domain-containing protein [Actinomycetes bacterium]
MMRHQLKTEITIDAPIEEVWAVLTDLDSFPEWNPFMTAAAGVVAEGERLEVTIRPPGAKGSTVNPRVTELQAGRVFEWLGHAGMKGLFDGRHRFELEPVTGGTKLIHEEYFSGLLVRPARGWLNRKVKPGFEAMNQALAERTATRALTR